MSTTSGRSNAISRKRLLLKRASTLAAAATAAAACEGYAYIVHVPVNEVLAFGESKDYDLDGDGWYDLHFDSYGIGSLIHGFTRTFGTSNVVVDPDNPGLLFAHQDGDTIGLLGVLSHAGVTNVDFYNQSPPRFAGFVFQPGADTLANHWGWAKINVTPDDSLRVFAFGYETEAWTPIIAGNIPSAVVGNPPSAPMALLQNMPNPFASETQIRFELPSADRATIRIYDVSGRRLRTVEIARAHRGLNTVSWDGSDEDGKPVASGIYFYTLEALGTTQTRRMVIIR